MEFAQIWHRAEQIFPFGSWHTHSLYAAIVNNSSLNLYFPFSGDIVKVNINTNRSTKFNENAFQDSNFIITPPTCQHLRSLWHQSVSVLFLCVILLTWQSKLYRPPFPMYMDFVQNWHRAEQMSPFGSWHSHSLYAGIVNNSSLNLHFPFSGDIVKVNINTNRSTNFNENAFQNGNFVKNHSNVSTYAVLWHQTVSVIFLCITLLTWLSRL